MAIAIDASSLTQSAGFTNSVTVSHTCTGTDLILLVGIHCRTDVVTGVTYNGTAMTFLGKNINSGVVGVQWYYLVGPSTGANNVVVSFSGFVLSAAAVVVAGLILTSQLGAASPQAATGLELSVVTAVILGGASLAGGRGTILGTLIGVLILGVLNNGLTLMNIDSFWQGVARGVLLLVAVGFDQLRLRVTEDK